MNHSQNSFSRVGASCLSPVEPGLPESNLELSVQKINFETAL